jgi:HSP20 family molecular chaperone IbpA
MSEKKEKTHISPEILMYPNDDHDTYFIEVNLPGVEKESIILKMQEDSFFISGEREDKIYIGTYAVCCPIAAKKAKARLKNGQLRIEVPFQEPEFHSVNVNIE